MIYSEKKEHIIISTEGAFHFFSEDIYNKAHWLTNLQTCKCIFL